MLSMTTMMTERVTMKGSRRRERLRGIALPAFLLVLLVVGASTTTALADCPLESPDERAAATRGLTAAFEDANFEVSQGAMWFFKFSDIDEDCDDCYYANPSSTYGCPLLVRVVSFGFGFFEFLFFRV